MIRWYRRWRIRVLHARAMEALERITQWRKVADEVPISAIHDYADLRGRISYHQTRLPREQAGKDPTT